MNRASSFTGLYRLASLDYSGTLSNEEKKIFTEVACHITANDTMIKENTLENVLDVTNELNSSSLPTAPMIMYVSADNSGQESWASANQAMVDASSNGKLIKLDCGHYVHDFEYERISKDMKEFIEGLRK